MINYIREHRFQISTIVMIMKRRMRWRTNLLLANIIIVF